jgi:hypothetical protein
MEIRIKRAPAESGNGWTHGRLSTDEGGFLCWTLEDTDRGLRQDMPLEEIKRRKVYGQTAIPAGRYPIQLRVSPRLGGRPYAQKYGGKLPYIYGVPGWSGVIIHPFNLPSESLGCIAPGMLRSGIRGRIFDSTAAFYDLMDYYIWPAYLRGEKIWLTID